MGDFSVDRCLKKTCYCALYQKIIHRFVKEASLLLGDDMKRMNKSLQVLEKFEIIIGFPDLFRA
jgi:hypothetical protein